MKSLLDILWIILRRELCMYIRDSYTVYDQSLTDVSAAVGRLFCSITCQPAG